MAGKSCVNNLLEYLERLRKLVDRHRGSFSDVGYLYFAKAIGRMLKKCKSLGIYGNNEAFLGGSRRNLQRRVFNGPTFLIYINEIDNAVDVASSVLRTFTDDTDWAMVVESDEERKLFPMCPDN